MENLRNIEAAMILADSARCAIAKEPTYERLDRSEPTLAHRVFVRLLERYQAGLAELVGRAA